MIVPTVSRAVWFWPSRAAQEAKMSQPYAATVAFVHSESLINISYVTHAGHQHGATNVPLIQEGEVAPEHGFYCEWMPYQHGQAKKTEAAESELAQRSGRVTDLEAELPKQY